MFDFFDLQFQCVAELIRGREPRKHVSFRLWPYLSVYDRVFFRFIPTGLPLKII